MNVLINGKLLRIKAKNHTKMKTCSPSLPFSSLPGCGNSSMSGEMYDAGYRRITNIDYSSVCVDAMAARHAHCPGMTWRQMDARQLDFPDASFDIVLEKATLDAMLVEEKDPWKVSPQTAGLIHQVLKEVG